MPPAARADLEGRREAARLVNEAKAAREKRDFRKAVALLEKAREIEGLGGMTSATIYLMLGDLYREEADFQKASLYFNLALQSAPDNLFRDEVILMEGDLFFLTGDYENGLERLARISSPQLSGRKALQQGKLLFGEARYPEALLSFKSALSHNPDSLDYAAALQNIAFTYWAMDSLSQADTYFSEALYFTEAVTPRLLNTVKSNMALLKSYQGEHYAALDLIDAAAEYFSGQDADARIVARKQAEIYLRAGKREQARKLFRKYFYMEKELLAENLAEMNEAQRLNLWARERADLAKCFLLEASDPEFLFDVALFRKQTSLLGVKENEALMNSLKQNSASTRRLLKKDEAALQFVTYPDTTGSVAYAALLLTPKGSAEFIPIFSESFLSERPGRYRMTILETLEKENKDELNRLYNDTVTARKIWEQVFSRLPKETRKIYFTTEGAFNFWGIESMPLPEGRDIELHRVTTIPVALAASKSRRPLASGDETLVAGGFDYDASPYLPDSPEASHVAWDAIQNRTAGRGVFFTPLPGTMTESDSIAAMLGATAIHELSEPQLKEIMGNYRLLHLATHGYSLVFGVKSELMPLLDSNLIDMSMHECGIALTGANSLKEEGREDNLISAAEISALDLSNVEFVVLSACQTAKGQVTDEGAAGLLRGLKNAGAKTVIVSLWSVDDNATMMFMKEMYRLLGEGYSKYDAFRGARANLRNFKTPNPGRKFSRKKFSTTEDGVREFYIYDEPYYWAPFIIVDDVL